MTSGDNDNWKTLGIVSAKVLEELETQNDLGDFLTKQHLIRRRVLDAKACADDATAEKARKDRVATRETLENEWYAWFVEELSDRRCGKRIGLCVED
jgi:hypothetical protein